MKTFKFLLSALISLSLIGCALAQNKKSKTVEKPKTKTAKTNDRTANEKPLDKPASDAVKFFGGRCEFQSRDAFCFRGSFKRNLRAAAKSRADICRAPAGALQISG